MTDQTEDPSQLGSRPAAALAALLSLLDLDPVENNFFRGISPSDRWQRVYGGQVLGQALVAAYRTLQGRVCHSLHAYFLRAGDPQKPILYEVDRSRDGRSFSARRVVAIQHGAPIFTMSASFEVAGDGMEHQSPMPGVPAPEELRSEQEWRSEIVSRLPEHVRGWFMRSRPIEIRPVLPVNRFTPEKRAGRQIVWFRAAGTLPDSHALHQCVLAYASDMTCLTRHCCPTATTCSRPNCNWPASIMQSGSIAPFAPMNGCSMCRKVRPLLPPAGSTAARFFVGMERWSLRWRRKD